jgi:glycosyltransferase involved in cell wall biosynthesis
MAALSIDAYSVVIPVFNNGHELATAILSAIQQTSPPCEIIICDDASTSTETKSLIRDFYSNFPSLIRVIANPSNAGAASTRNSGISAAKYDIVAFLDADDSWLPSKMETQLILFRFSNIIACGCRLSPQKVSRERAQFIRFLATRDLLFKNYIQPSTFVARRNSLLEVGMFPDGQRHAEEGDLYLKLSGIQPIAFINSRLVVYNTRPSAAIPRGQASRLSGSVYRMYLGNLKNLARACRRGQINKCELFFFSSLLPLRYVVTAMSRLIKSRNKD